jgi:alpha-glucosidase
VIFLNQAGEIILQDHPRYPVAWNGKEFRVWKSMPEDEHYFGLGEKPGPLDHRNQAFTNWNTDAYGWQESTDPLYDSIPFFLGFRGGAAYGVFLDNTYRTSFDFGKEARDRFSFGAEGGELDYYFFYGPHPRKVIEDYTALTGRTPLPPLFALGFQQSRYSYFPEARVREIARQFRQRRIPADVLYLDIDYQQQNRPFTVDTERFPHFREMVRDLGKEGFKLVLITDLHVAKVPGSKPYEEGLAHDYFVKNPDGSVYVGKVWPGDSVFPDFTRAEVRRWYGTLYQQFVEDGIRGFWNDMNEPAIFFRDDKTMPLDTVHRVDGRVTDHREIHNVFGMENACATYEGLLRLRPDERPFVLTRAAYAGTQRCAATWTGDNSSTWNHLRISVPMLLNLGVSGYALVGDDIGGYAGSPPADLLTRWLEVGAFNPLYRDHTEKGSADQEPWVHGPEHEAIRRRYIELRYQLLPYIYTAMEETSRTGVPLMRPMFLEFPQDRAMTTVDSEFMFGDALLVVPKLTERLDSMEVKLPAGTWYDFWTGETFQGGTTWTMNPALDSVPVYVRAGAIVPMQPTIQYVGEIPQGQLQVHVYPGPNCHGTIYADDGNTLAYQRGEFQRTAFTCETTTDGVRVKLAAPAGSYKPWWQSFDVRVHGGKDTPREVTVGGKEISNARFDGGTRSVPIQVPAGVATEIVVRY